MSFPPFVVAAGAQFRATDRLGLRGGYNFSENPIPDEPSFFNVAAPALVQHHLTLGAGFEGVGIAPPAPFIQGACGRLHTPGASTGRPAFCLRCGSLREEQRRT